MSTPTESPDDICAMGESFGLDEAAAELLEEAKKCFAIGDDKLAELLRDWAKHFKDKADARYIHPDVFSKPEIKGHRGSRKT